MGNSNKKPNFGNLAKKLNPETTDKDEILQSSARSVLPVNNAASDNSSIQSFLSIKDFLSKPDPNIVGAEKSVVNVYSNVHISMKKAANIMGISILDLYTNITTDFLIQYKEELKKLDKQNSKNSLL